MGGGRIGSGAALHPRRSGVRGDSRARRRARARFAHARRVADRRPPLGVPAADPAGAPGRAGRARRRRRRRARLVRPGGFGDGKPAGNRLGLPRARRTRGRIHHPARRQRGRDAARRRRRLGRHAGRHAAARRRRNDACRAGVGRRRQGLHPHAAAAQCRRQLPARRNLPRPPRDRCRPGDRYVRVRARAVAQGGVSSRRLARRRAGSDRHRRRRRFRFDLPAPLRSNDLRASRGAGRRDRQQLAGRCRLRRRGAGGGRERPRVTRRRDRDRRRPNRRRGQDARRVERCRGRRHRRDPRRLRNRRRPRRRLRDARLRRRRDAARGGADPGGVVDRRTRGGPGRRRRDRRIRRLHRCEALVSLRLRRQHARADRDRRIGARRFSRRFACSACWCRRSTARSTSRWRS